MTRLKRSIDLHDFHRYVLVFGPGIGDIFMVDDGRQLDFLTNFNEDLQSKGYQRILHISPTKPVHVLDAISEKLSENHLWKFRNDVLATGIIQDIRIGPLGKVEASNPQAGGGIKKDGLGDVNGLRIVDAMMKEENHFRTALVVYNAEVFLGNFSDKRVLGGVLSEWLQLPLNNQNTIFFIFTNSEPDDISETIRKLPVPELKALITSEGGRNPARFFVPGPDLDELNNLLDHMDKVNHVKIQVPNQRLFLKWLESEGVLLRTWYDRFSSYPVITLEIVRNNGWLSSSQGDPRSFEEKLEDLVGLGDIKDRILEIRDWMSYQQNEKSDLQSTNLHMVFFGNPGTGKTTLARLMGEMFHEYGILNRGHLVETKASDLVADVVGGTAQKTNRVIDRAIEGLLFIDEAYSLSAKERGGFGQEAIETLLVRMENERSNLVVIMAGYPGKMREFLASNPGLDRRFPTENRFEFKDFTNSELELILVREMDKRDLKYDQEFKERIPSFIQKMKVRLEGFGNAGEIRNFVDSLERRCKARSYKEQIAVPIVTLSDLPDEYRESEIDLSPEDILAEFETFVGLEKVKTYLVSMVRLIHLEKVRQAQSRYQTSQSLLENFLFLGNPGTGKTSVARMIGRIYKSLGLLKRGHCIEVSASNLIAGYVGQTSEKTKEVVLNALDGVLFIDEAYSLSRGQAFGSVNYGQEALDVIVKYMEDFRERLVVIAAGYPDEMIEFINSNPGLRSRFGYVLEFDDFSEEELGEIFYNLMTAEGFTSSQETIIAVRKILENMRTNNPKNFGNAREVRRLFSYMKRSQANRIFQDHPGSDPRSLPIDTINELLPVDAAGFEQAGQRLDSLPYLLPPQFQPVRKRKS